MVEEKRLEKIRIIEEGKLEQIRIKDEYLKSDEYINRHKVCNKCNELKPFDDFHKGVNGSTLPDCKKCYNLRKTEQKKIRMETDDEYREKTRLSSMNKWNRRMSTDPLYRFRKLLSNNIRKCFKSGGYSKTSRAHEILGAEWLVIKEYFESKFTEGMSWENYGEWQIDHILPISTATCEEDIIRLNHYTNLQPLWKEDNLRKSNKMTVEGYLKEKFPYGIVSKTL
jgi:ribosome-binding protein aMBF1 (putative translation factor)